MSEVVSTRYQVYAEASKCRILEEVHFRSKSLEWIAANDMQAGCHQPFWSREQNKFAQPVIQLSNHQLSRPVIVWKHTLDVYGHSIDTHSPIVVFGMVSFIYVVVCYQSSKAQTTYCWDVGCGKLEGIANIELEPGK